MLILSFRRCVMEDRPEKPRWTVAWVEDGDLLN